MSSFYYDLILSGLTYVLLTYLTFTLMKRRKKSSEDDNDGGIITESGPKIDLPPGIFWPDGSGSPIHKKVLEEDAVY
ncbi:MAG: hypothetical protein HWE07_09865 [Cytophagia bacterium]|nr:hypothetical protein [Cytophagia bacterium]